MLRVFGRRALRRQAIYSGGVPRSIRPPPQHAEGNAFRAKLGMFTRLQAIADVLKIGSDLPREHFIVAGAEHIRGGATVGNGLQSDCGASFVDTAAGGD